MQKNHIIQRPNGIYYYQRRVPTHVKDIMGKDMIFLSLKTRDPDVARKKASHLNDGMERLWDELFLSGSHNQEARYQNLIKIARVHGFPYVPTSVLSQQGADNVVSRVLALNEKDIESSGRKVESLLGGMDKPQLMLDDCFEQFVEFSRPDLVGKSEEQKKRWHKPRETAFARFVEIVGNKPVASLVRADILKAREHHVSRYEAGEISAHTANRQLERVSAAIRKVEDTLQLGIDVSSLFSKIKIAEKPTQRPAYDRDFIQNVLLDEERFTSMNSEARAAILIAINTGLRLGEICGLEQEDIVLKANIPYVSIRNKRDYQIKTLQSERDIPLLGVSLEAMSMYPHGFKRYFRKSDSLSSFLNKYLRQNDMKPTSSHSVYSLRHSFQDSLRQYGIDERLQCELMGHKYNRPVYGSPSLEEKHAAIAKFAL